MCHELCPQHPIRHPCDMFVHSLLSSFLIDWVCREDVKNICALSMRTSELNIISPYRCCWDEWCCNLLLCGAPIYVPTTSAGLSQHLHHTDRCGSLKCFVTTNNRNQCSCHTLYLSKGVGSSVVLRGLTQLSIIARLGTHTNGVTCSDAKFSAEKVITVW